MATEVELLLLFPGEAPDPGSIEAWLDCDVLEYIPTEVE